MTSALYICTAHKTENHKSIHSMMGCIITSKSGTREKKKKTNFKLVSN